MPIHKMVQCVSAVNKDQIRREQISGIEHIIVSSYTLPDNVVMNDILYPADEINKSFKTLERTLAPVEHPTDSDGNFISASDPDAIHNFHAGAFNVNVTRENGRVHIEKHVNVQEALKTDRGKRLLDRINELETSEKPRQIHTSTGVFLLIEELSESKTNDSGDKYSMIARDMVFDHDAILLDSVGAATPEQGVGMAVNSKGDKIDVDRVSLSKEGNAISRISSGDLGRIKSTINKHISNAEGMSFRQVMDALHEAVRELVAAEWIFLVDVFENDAIFETNAGFFSVPYNIREGVVSISGVPIRVDKQVEYQPKINRSKEGERMKELILNALAEAGISTEGLTDDQLFAEYNKFQANSQEPGSESDNDDDSVKGIAEAVANAVKPLTDQISALTTQVNADSDAEKARLIDIIVNSKKYPGIDKDAAGALPIDSLKEMAANCESAHGVPFSVNIDGNDDNAFSAPAEMPK